MTGSSLYPCSIAVLTIEGYSESITLNYTGIWTGARADWHYCTTNKLSIVVTLDEEEEYHSQKYRGNYFKVNFPFTSGPEKMMLIRWNILK